ncbi:hypothetical protein FHS85_004536 [Rhodoligotrophos appendicifer]|uniref:hypothetical protein n=1 Tax=Rhodoligotrophos appendicifer TaxID=987056 RepID=UPI0011853D28|nr:hypothetical protein [Rhodoligotrophos appendicifer]
MREVFRIGVAGRAIHIRRWPSWEAFDAERPGPIDMPCVLAYADGEVRLEATDGAGFEIQRIRVNNGAGSAARTLIAADLAAWQDAGATVIGSFEIVHGHDLPARVLILNWTSIEQAGAAQRTIESDPGAQARRRTERTGAHRSAIRISSRLLGCTLSVAR